MPKLKQKILEERSRYQSTSHVGPFSGPLFTGLSAHRRAALFQWLGCLFSHSFADHVIFPYSLLLPRPYITHWTDDHTDSLAYRLLKLSLPRKTGEKSVMFGFKECTKMIKGTLHDAAPSTLLIVAIDLEWVVYRDTVVKRLLAQARQSKVPMVFALSVATLGTFVAANQRKSALVGSACLRVAPACRGELDALLDDLRVCRCEFRAQFLSYLQMDSPPPSPLWICCWYGLEEHGAPETSSSSQDTNLLGLVLAHPNFRALHLLIKDAKLGLDPLLACAVHGHHGQIKMLVEQKYSQLDHLSSRSFKGQNIVSLLCEQGDADCLQYVLQARAGADDFQKWLAMPSYHGWPPIRYAISNGQLSIFDVLERYMQLPSTQDAQKETPLFWLMRSEPNMTQYRFIEIFKRLVQNDKNGSCSSMAHENSQGQSVLDVMFSVIKSEPVAIKMLKILNHNERGQRFLFSKAQDKSSALYELARQKQWTAAVDFLDRLRMQPQE